MKKAFALLLVLVMCLVLAACGEGSTPTESNNNLNANTSALTGNTETVIQSHPLLGKVYGEWELSSPEQAENAHFAAFTICEDGTCVADGVLGTWKVNTKYTNDTDLFLDLYSGESYLGAIFYDGNDERLWTSDTAGTVGPGHYVNQSGVIIEEGNPEPVYETIEITMDNWQEYLEFRQSDVEWTEDAFGDVDSYMFVILFAIREEYLDIVKPDTIDIAFSCSYVQEYHYYNIDFENRTFAIGETVPKELLSAGVYSGEEHETNPKKMTRTECDAWHNLQYRDIITHWDANGTELISWADALDISRIQGTIEIQTN